MNDQIVYQAIANYLADKFYRSLRPYYGVKTFGAQYASKNSKFFYRSWKGSYRGFNSSIKKSYLSGNDVLADFDLVSFFDLIDHEILRRVLEARVKRREVLDLLLACLRKWTAGNPTIYVRGHGIPQGPEPSAFLAEILLTIFDKVKYPKVTYLRYVDDIKLLAKDFSPVRRALLRLDLQAKRLGLVPQAQKIEVRRVTDITSELKSVPSSIAGAASTTPRRILSKTTIRRLTKLLRGAIAKRKGGLAVTNETHFKFALYRLPSTRRTLKLIAPLMYSRPDLSPVIAFFLLGFSKDPSVAELIHNGLKSDPVFDAAAGDYVLALDSCALNPGLRKYRLAVSKLMAKSEEKSLLLDVPCKIYCLKRSGKPAASAAITTENDPLVASRLIHALLLDPVHACVSYRDLKSALSGLANTTGDEDLARFCTYLMLVGLRLVPRHPRAAGSLILKHLGYAIPPAASSFLTSFFKDIFKINLKVDWERVLGTKAHSELQRRAIAIRGNWAGSPSLLVTTLDSFNDLLVQRFSRASGKLKRPFRRAAGKNAIPDFGKWLNDPALIAALPKTRPVLSDMHQLRVRAEIAHATNRRTGQFTRPVSYREKDQVIAKLRAAYFELLTECSKI